MNDSTTQCSECNRSILQRTADRNRGLCAICLRNAERRQKAPIVPSARLDIPGPLAIPLRVPKLDNDKAVDWKEIEDALYQIGMHYTLAFAPLHHDERFYAFAFDCNADCCAVSACLNTEESLGKFAREHQQKWPKLYGEKTQEQLQKELRWSLGDWEYECSTAFSLAWQPIQDALRNAVPWDVDDEQALPNFRESFIRMACRAMIRLESAGVFNLLNRTEDFKIFVAGHDEIGDQGWNRLESVRSEEDTA